MALSETLVEYLSNDDFRPAEVLQAEMMQTASVQDSETEKMKCYNISTDHNNERRMR